MKEEELQSVTKYLQSRRTRKRMNVNDIVNSGSILDGGALFIMNRK